MSYRFRRLVAFIALESWASHAASCPKPPPLDVAELDGAITSFRAAATQTERNKLNAVIVGDLLVSVNGQRCNSAFERRRLMIHSFSTSSKIELLFWRPPDGFVVAVAPGAGAGGSGSGSGGGIGADSALPAPFRIAAAFSAAFSFRFCV